MTRIEKLAPQVSERLPNIARVFQRRTELAQKRYTERIAKATEARLAEAARTPPSPWDLWQGWADYAVDSAQRSVLFLDTLRQRGNNYLEHEKAGKPPLLHFDCDMVLDARAFARPVNYSLVRIVPPKGIKVDAKRRPDVIIDPRAGHGPGIGGFKDDSQVGVALREYSPCSP